MLPIAREYSSARKNAHDPSNSASSQYSLPGSDAVPGLDRGAEQTTVDFALAGLLIDLVGGRVVNAREREPREIVNAILLVGLELALFERLDDPAERLDGRASLAQAHVRDALEDAGLHVPLGARGNLLEQLDGLLELALGVLGAAQQVEQLVVDGLALAVVELLDLREIVATDLLDDARGLRQLRGELRKPLQGLLEEEVPRTLLADLVEDRERRLVVAAGGRATCPRKNCAFC